MQDDKDLDKGTEPTEDESMAGAFDFEVPEGDPDELSDDGDDDGSANDNGDGDGSAENQEGDGEGDGQAADPIDPKLLVRAGRMGLNDEDTDRILGLGSSKAVSDMLDILESRKGQSSTGGETEEAEWFEFDEEKEGEFSDELVDVLKSMNGSTKKAVEQLLGKYEQRIQQMDQALAGRDSNAFDDAVESLGKDWEPVFGKEGKTESEHKNNLERLKQVVFSDQYKGSVARRVKDAAKNVFAEHSNKIANDGKVKKARNRQGRFIGRPAQRSMDSKDMSPRQRAVSNAAKFMKERGMHPEQTAGLDLSEAV